MSLLADICDEKAEVLIFYTAEKIETGGGPETCPYRFYNDVNYTIIP